MQNVSIINGELIKSSAPNAAAIANAKKISQQNGFQKLCISEDETLIFGECKGSGKNPYYTSADFSGESPVFRCSCHSRQFPCKHAIAIMCDYLAGKTFVKTDIPEDIRLKREKIAKKAEKSAEKAERPAPKKNTAAVVKKLQKQREGLELAESFVNDILSNGAASVSKASAERYLQLAKQLGDYYLPAEKYTETEQRDENDLRGLIQKCVRLSSSVKKCREYIDRKLENGEVLPEDSILYEAMGGVWKLTQLKELGLYRENVSLVQLSFTVIDKKLRKELVETGCWIDLGSGEIFRTENIRPYKSLKHIKETDSSFRIYSIDTLYLYPGSMNRRVRWEGAVTSPATADTYRTIISHAEESIAEAVKKSKNELKNTLSEPYTIMLLPFDRIESTSDGQPVLIRGEEKVLLKANEDHQDTVDTLKLIAGNLYNGAMLCAVSYDSTAKSITISPVSAVTENGITRL